MACRPPPPPPVCQATLGPLHLHECAAGGPVASDAATRSCQHCRGENQPAVSALSAGHVAGSEFVFQDRPPGGANGEALPREGPVGPPAGHQEVHEGRPGTGRRRAGPGLVAVRVAPQREREGERLRLRPQLLRRLGKGHRLGWPSNLDRTGGGVDRRDLVLGHLRGDYLRERCGRQAAVPDFSGTFLDQRGAGPGIACDASEQRFGLYPLRDR